MAKAGIVYAGTDDGIVIFSDPGGIGRWRRVGHELRGHTVRAILPQSALALLVAAVGMGVQRSTDGGQSWQPVLEADVVALAAHASVPETPVAATTSGAIWQSDDGGANWHAGNQPMPATVSDAVQMLAMPTDPQRLFLALHGTVWVSHNAGEQWDPYGAALPGAITGLVASPGRAHILFAAADGIVYRAGVEAAWEPLELFAGGPGHQITLAMLAGQQEVLLAALSTDDSVVFVRSDDDGASWQMAQVATPLQGPVTVITPASFHMDTAWAGTASGQLLRSDDRGRTWEQIAQEPAAIRSLAVVRLA